MPRVTWQKSAEQKEKEAEFRERYGGCMIAAEVAREIRSTDGRNTNQWLSDIPYLMVGKRRHYPIEHIAAKFIREQVKP